MDDCQDHDLVRLHLVDNPIAVSEYLPNVGVL